MPYHSMIKLRKTHQYISNLESTQPGLYFAGNYRDGISIANSIKSGRTIAERIIENQSTGKESDANPTLDENRL